MIESFDLTPGTLLLIEGLLDSSLDSFDEFQELADGLVHIESFDLTPVGMLLKVGLCVSLLHWFDGFVLAYGLVVIQYKADT